MKSLLVAAAILFVGSAAHADCTKEVNCLAIKIRAVKVAVLPTGATVFRHEKSSQQSARTFMGNYFDECQVKQFVPWERQDDGAEHSGVSCADGALLAIIVDAKFMFLSEMKEK